MCIAQAGTPAQADVVTDWNATVSALPIAAPPVMARILASMHGAMYDAVNSVDPRYEAFRFPVQAPAGASKEAAAATAAHDVLAGIIPPQRPQFDAALKASLANIPDGQAKTDGIAVGKAVAEKMLAWRATDGFAKPTSDKPGNGPGVWQRTPPAMAPGVLPGLGAVTPFILKSADQFPAKGRFALDSADFASELKEIKSLGARNSTARTSEQTAVAIYWSVNELTILNAAARAAAQKHALSLDDSARLFALMSMASADAAIVVFKVKYEKNAWRPVTAIREGAAGTTPDPAWEPLLITPPHPEYPSAHCILTGAAFQVMRDYFRTDEIAFQYASPAPFGALRKFTSLSQIEREVEDSRVWGGIHFRSSDEEATELGRKIGAYAFANSMRKR